MSPLLSRTSPKNENEGGRKGKKREEKEAQRATLCLLLFQLAASLSRPLFRHALPAPRLGTEAWRLWECKKREREQNEARGDSKTRRRRLKKKEKKKKKGLAFSLVLFLSLLSSLLCSHAPVASLERLAQKPGCCVRGERGLVVEAEKDKKGK
jgi:hypothetical protein